jgi:tetratricopeptide (TPR) repeat protein
MSNTDAKPKLDMRSLKSLKPLIGRELVVGTTHRGRYLCGWVAVDDAFFGIASSSLLLEDVTGQLVEVAAYGLVDPDLPALERQRALAGRFSKGQPIVVFEPYYKVRQDMSEGIRVEQAKEMIQWRDVPKDLAAWKKLHVGNDYFSVLSTKNQGRGALACYQRAIDAVKEDVSKVAVLLNNIATCRFKMGDYKAAVRLAGAAVHLDPRYVKGWFCLASALIEESEAQGDGGKRAVAERVVAHVIRVISTLSAKERRLLEGTLKKAGLSSSTADGSRVQSFVEWCTKLEAPGFLMQTSDLVDKAKDVDAWRKAGSEYFIKGDLQAAEECYRKGVAASASCCHEVAPVLNNIAAVHLMVKRETSAVPEITVGRSGEASDETDDQVSSPEAALLNSTIAGIIDPLNYKAWTRRSRCLQTLGYTQEECIADLNAIRASVVSKAFSSAEDRDRVHAFKSCMSVDVERRSQEPLECKPQVSEVSTDTQRAQRDALQPDKIAAAVMGETNARACSSGGDEKESIDAYIARMETVENVTRFGFAASMSKKSSRQKKIPLEMTMFVKHPAPQIHTEFPKLRGWPNGIDSTFAQKVLHRAYLDANANPWVIAMSMREGSFPRRCTLAT